MIVNNLIGVECVVYIVREGQGDYRDRNYFTLIIGDTMFLI